MIVQNNLMALYAQRQMSQNNLKLQSSLQKLSSGYRINSAADDAAGLAISERMRAQQTGLNRAMMNAQDGVSLVQTAEGALTQVHGALNRLSDLAVQASNGTLNASQRNSIQKEANDLLKEIDRISQATNFNGVNLLDGSMGPTGAQTAEVAGVAVNETAATPGQYSFDLQDFNGLSAGDEISFNFGMNNGQSNTVSFTVGDDLQTLTASDGRTIHLQNAPNGDGTVNISGEQMAGEVAQSLQGMSAGLDFAFSQNADGSVSIQNSQAGTGTTTATGLNYAVNGGGYQSAGLTQTSAPADAVRSISQDSLQVFDGSNESNATFSVNGENFVLVNENDYDATVAQLANRDVNIIKVEGTQGNLTSNDLSSIAAEINQKTGMAFSAGADSITVKGPNNGNGLQLQVGDTADVFNQLNVQVGNMSSSGLGIAGLDFSSVEAANASLARISNAIDKVSTTRGDLGATQNRLEYTISNLETTQINITAAESRIRDTDMAKMLMDFTKQNILSQTSQAMLAQANLQSQQVLQLLR